MLDKINFPKDFKNLSLNDKKVLAGEIRNILIDTVSKTRRPFGL